MESMISLDGANLIFADLLRLFRPAHARAGRGEPQGRVPTTPPACGRKDKHPANAGSYFAYLNQAHHVNGIVAGLDLEDRQARLRRGRADSDRAAQHQFLCAGRAQRQSASHRAGDLHRRLVVAGARGRGRATRWPTAAATSSPCHVDSPKVVVETAERRGLFTAGHNASQAPLAPKGFLTGAEYKWETIYKEFADAIGKGQKLPNFVRGGFDKDYVQNTPFGAAVSPQAKAAALKAIADLKANKPYFVGPIKDNKGNDVVPEGKSHRRLRSGPRGHELPGGGRRGLDHLGLILR